MSKGNSHSIQFFPYSISYQNIPNDQDPHTGECIIQIFARKQSQENKQLDERICIQVPFTPYFYIQLQGADESKIQEFLHKQNGIKETSKTSLSLYGDNQEFLKVETNFPEQVIDLNKELTRRGLKCFEADIPIRQRFLIDTKIIPLKLTKAELTNTTKTNLSLPTYDTTIESLVAVEEESASSTLSFPRTLAIDIETYNEVMTIDMDNNPILMVAIYGQKSNGDSFEKVITYKTPSGNPAIKDKQTVSYTVIKETEKEMLTELANQIKEFNPEFISSYYGDGFDLPYIKRRAEILNINLNITPDGSDIYAGGTTVKKALLTGIPHLDVLKFIKYIYGVYWKIDSYSLDNVANKLLGENKIDVDLANLAPAWNQNNELLEQFIKYNLHDAKITFQLTQKVWQSITEFCAIVGIMPDDLIRMRFSRLVENFLLKQAKDKHILQPQRPSQQQISFRMTKHIEGAFVLQPKPNLYHDLVVFDFLSLYPTIIISHNVGRETVLTKSKLDKLPKKDKPKKESLLKVPERTYQINNEKTSFIAQELGIIVNKRVELKKQVADLKKQLISNKNKQQVNQTKEKVNHIKSQLDALKVLANSFYGYFAFYGARWYSFEGADSITAFARHYIKDVIQKAKDAGFQVVYSDTDSIMITLTDPQTKKKIKTQKDAHDFVDQINKNLPGAMELEFEGYFPRAIFVASKGDKNAQTGAKKKYALIDEKEQMKITGFETVRRNWSRVAKDTQKEFLKYVLTDNSEDGIEHLKNIIKDLQNHKLSVDQIILKMQLKQPVEKYKAIGPHVKVAKDMIKEGKPVSTGSLIEYVVTKGKGPIRDRAVTPKQFQKNKMQYDEEYYLNNQLIPSVESILNVLKINVEELTKKSTQKGLGGFF